MTKSKSESNRLESALDIILSFDHQIFHTTFDLNKLLSEMLKELCRLTGAEYAQILLRRGASLQITHSTQPTDKGQEFQIRKCLSGLAVEKRKTISSGNVEQDYPRRYKWILGVDQETRMRSEIAVPILAPTTDRVATGVLNIESPQLSAFSKDVERIVEQFATHAGLAIHMARIQAGLGLTYQLAESIEKNQLESHEALRNTLRLLAVFFRNQVVVQFLLYNPVTDSLRIESSNVETTEGQRVLVSDSFSGIVIREQRAVLSKNVGKEYPQHFQDTVGDAVNRPTVSELAVPVFEEDRIIGVLNVESPRKDAFDEHDQYVLTLFASNANLWKRLSQARRTQAREKMATIGEVAANMIHILRSDLVRLGQIADRLETISATASPALQVAPLLEELRSIAASAIKRSQDVQEKYKRALEPPKATDINEEARKAVEKLVTRAEIKVEYQLDEEMPVIMASPGILDVIQSLVSNSQKAMTGDSQGVLTIGTKASRGLYTNQIEAFELFVTDTGKGMTDEMQKRAFELGVSEGDAGHGWGLFIVETFVDRWQGRIDLQSQLGKGTSIRLWFPLTFEDDIVRMKGGQ